MIGKIIGISISLIPLYLITLPIGINGESFDLNRESKDLLFALVSILTIFLCKGRLRKIPKYFFVLLTYILFMIIFNHSSRFSTNYNYHSTMIVIGSILFVRLYKSICEIDLKYIYNGMIIGALIQSIFCISMFFGLDSYTMFLNIFKNVKTTTDVSGAGGIIGSFGQNNLLSSYMCITIPAFFYKKETIILSIFPITALLMSQTWMGISSLVAGLFYYFIMKYNIISKAKIYLFAITGMVIIPFFNIDIDSGRFLVWRKMLSNASLKNWIIGMGPGWFADIEMRMPSAPDTAIIQEHNSYLTIFNTFGIIGLLLVFPIFYKYIKSNDNNILLSSIIFIIFCNSWGHFTLQQSTVMIIIIPLLAISLGNLYDNKA